MQCRRHVKAGAYVDHFRRLVQSDTPVLFQINGCQTDALRDTLFQYLSEPFRPGKLPGLFRRKIDAEEGIFQTGYALLEAQHLLPQVCRRRLGRCVGAVLCLEQPVVPQRLEHVILLFRLLLKPSGILLPELCGIFVVIASVGRVETEKYVIELSYRGTLYLQELVHQVHIVPSDNPYRQFPVFLSGYVRPVIDRLVVFLYYRC